MCAHAIKSRRVRSRKMRPLWQPSSFRKVDEISRDFNPAEIIQIVMTAPGKADKPFRLVRQRKQPFAEGNGYRRIERTMHHEQRNLDPRNVRVGTELISYQQTY